MVKLIFHWHFEEKDDHAICSTSLLPETKNMCELMENTHDEPFSCNGALADFAALIFVRCEADGRSREYRCIQQVSSLENRINTPHPHWCSLEPSLTHWFLNATDLSDTHYQNPWIFANCWHMTSCLHLLFWTNLTGLWLLFIWAVFGEPENIEIWWFERLHK